MKELVIVFNQKVHDIIHQCFYGKGGCVLMDKKGEESGGCKLCDNLWNPLKGENKNSIKCMCSNYDMSSCVAIELDSNSIFIKQKDGSFKLLKDIIDSNKPW